MTHSHIICTDGGLTQVWSVLRRSIIHFQEFTIDRQLLAPSINIQHYRYYKNTIGVGYTISPASKEATILGGWDEMLKW